MEPTFRHLPKRDGTMIQVPSMPWSSGPTPPRPFRAPCCGQEITGERVSVIQGALAVWQWRYCACMREALAIAAEERERHEQDVRRRERWEVQQRSLDTLFPQWRQSAKVPRQTLANFVVSVETRGLVERIKVWTAVVNPTEGFLLTGRVGNGKTHIIRGVAHQMRAQYRTVLYTTVPYLLEHLRGPTGVDMDAVLKATTRADVVVWDDLGAEKPSDWALDRLYLLLDARYEAEKSLLATSNLSPNLLEERVGARIVSRLMEMGPVWEVPGGDYRLLLARKRLAAG